MLDGLLLTGWLLCQSLDMRVSAHKPAKVIINGALLVGYFRTKRKPVRIGIATGMATAGCFHAWWDTQVSRQPNDRRP